MEKALQLANGRGIVKEPEKNRLWVIQRMQFAGKYYNTGGSRGDMQICLWRMQVTRFCSNPSQRNDNWEKRFPGAREHHSQTRLFRKALGK